MAGASVDRHDWINLTASPSVHLTVPGRSVSATRWPQPYQYPSSPSGKVDPGDDEADQRLLFADATDVRPRQHSKRFTWRSCIAYVPQTTLTRSFVLTLIVQAIVCVSLEAYIFSFTERLLDWMKSFSTDPASLRSSAIPVMLGPFITVIFECLYQIFLGLFAARRRNTIQAIGICLNNLCICLFAGLAYGMTTDLVATELHVKAPPRGLRGALSALIAMLAIGMLVLGCLTWRLYKEFEW